MHSLRHHQRITGRFSASRYGTVTRSSARQLLTRRLMAVSNWPTARHWPGGSGSGFSLPLGGRVCDGSRQAWLPRLHQLYRLRHRSGSLSWLHSTLEQSSLWGIPTTEALGYPVVIDWATSVIAMGRVQQLSARAKHCPRLRGGCRWQ